MLEEAKKLEINITVSSPSFQVLEQQKAVEERRAREMESHLFSHDAEDFWRRQERTWREEKKARDKLMGDVVNGWTMQIQDKIRGGYFF